MKLLPFETRFLETFSDTKERSMYKIQLPDQESLLTLKRDLSQSREALTEEVLLGRASGLYPSSDLVVWKGQLCLVRDFVVGTPLSQIVRVEGRDLGTFLDLAVACTEALARLHAKGIIHRALNPANLLLDAHGEVHVVDLVLAAKLPLQPKDYQHPLATDWSLAYAAPELTGRMSRPQDFRTDYYSLGAVLYHLATGHAPIVATETLEVLHQIFAVNPAEPSELRPEIPAVISRLLMRLLSKNPEDRYQSLAGLLNDLSYARDLFRKTGKVADFELGRSDLASQLVLSRRLYGREHERDELVRAFESAAQGQGGLFLVEGPSGIGKTLFSNHVLSDLTRNRGKLFSANFNSLGVQQPFHGWSSLLNGIGLWLHSEPPEVRDLWLESASLYLRGLERLLLPLVPSLQNFWGGKAPLEELEGRDQKLRFHLAVKSFLQSLEHFASPLVLLIDDLQWADSASLDLLADLLQQTRLTHVLFVANAQSGGPSHALGVGAASLRPWSRLLGSVRLGPFDATQCGFFLGDSLRVSEDEIQDLARRLMPMSGGFPLMLGFLIQSSYEKGLLSYDVGRNRWNWKLELLPPEPPGEDTLPVILEGLRELKPEVTTLLQAAAIQGQRFSLQRLAQSVGVPAAEVHVTLWRLIKDGTLRPEEPDYQFRPESPEFARKEYTFVFSHPRIQWAVYHSMPEDVRAQTHLAQAERERARQDLLWDPERLFEAAMQYVAGFAAIGAGHDRLAIREVLMAAGAQSLKGADFDRSRQILQTALELTPPEDSENLVSLGTRAAEAAYLSHHETESFQLLDLALARVTDPTQRLRVRETWIRLLYWDNRSAEAVALARSVLAQEGLNIPTKPQLPQIIAGAVATGFRLPESRIGEIAKMRTAEKPYSIALLKVLRVALDPFYFAALDAYPLLIFQLVRQSVKRGFLPESLVGLASYAILLLGPLGQVKAGYRLAKTVLQLLPERKAMRSVGVASFVDLHFGSYHFDPVDTLPERTEAAQQQAVLAGDMEYAGWLGWMAISQRYVLGDDAQELLAKAQELKENQIHQGLHTQIPLTEFLMHILRTISEQEVFEHSHTLPPALQKLADQARAANNTTVLEFMHMPRATALLWSCRFHEAWSAWSAVASEFTPIPVFISTDSAFLRLWSGLLAAGSLTASNPERARLLAAVKKLRPGLEKRAARNPASYAWQVAVLDAELISLGRGEWSDTLWRELHTRVRQAGHERIAGLLAQVVGRRQNDPELRRRWLDMALESCLVLGMHPIAALIRGELEKGETTTEEARPERRVNLDTLTLAKASEALVQEIHLEKLMERLELYAVENVGAQKAYFLLPQQGDWSVELAVNTNQPRSKWFEPVHMPWKEFEPLPKSVVQSCLSTEKPVVIEDAQTRAPFSHDPAIRAAGSRSILCLPFLHQGKITGLMYLSNDLTPGAFQEGRLPVLGVLAGQIAVSLENAQLYAQMESLVQERTLQLEQEKANSERLLLNVLPEQVAQELKTWGRSDARFFDYVTVLFADIVGFTQFAEKTEPAQLIDELDHYFKAFDRMAESHGVEKIKTIGDAYLCVGGLPRPTGTHAVDVVSLALDVMAWMESERLRREALGLQWFEVRIGIHTGPVIAGVVGLHKFAYDIWGDTVNVAARMEQNGKPGAINISESTRLALGGRYQVEDRGAVAAKNKGEIKMYFVRP